MIQSWFYGLGEKYGVDPLVFGSIYLGGIPFLYAALGWAIFNARRRRPVFVPLLLAGLCFVSSYVYVIAAGRKGRTKSLDVAPLIAGRRQEVKDGAPLVLKPYCTSMGVMKMMFFIESAPHRRPHGFRRSE